MTHLAIFASGSGSNARKILKHFEGHPDIRVSLVISNRIEPGVKAHATHFQIPFKHLSKNDINDPGVLLPILQKHNVDLLVLAGFLLLVPEYLVDTYAGKILNIHPALLPKFGGKGMYGMHVHRAVKSSGDLISGMTIHKVDLEYDKGEILFQAATKLDPEDTPEEIAARVLALEHKYYAPVIEDFIIHANAG